MSAWLAKRARFWEVDSQWTIDLRGRYRPIPTWLGRWIVRRELARRKP